MGKAQTKKKTQRWRHNPIRVPDSHLGGGNGEGKADQGKEKQMLPILQKMKSPNYADRTWACAAICTLIQNDPATRRLFQGKNVVLALVERLSDDVDEVVVEASGALRNLAIDGGHELCSEMFNRGIMSHLIVLMRKISETIDSILSSNPDDPAPLTADQLQARKHLLALSENVITLIWCLAEATHRTLDAVNGAGVEGLLVKVIEARKVCGTGAVLAAAQALYCLTQDNWPFTKSLLRHSSALASLSSACREDFAGEEAKSKGKKKQANGDSAPSDDGRSTLARLLLCGTLRNIVRPDSASDATIDIRGLTNEVILPLVQPLLNINLGEVVAEVQQLVLQAPEQTISKSQDKNVKTDHRSPVDIRLEHLERTLNTLAVGLEILTGICAGVEDDNGDEEANGEVVEDGEEDEEMIDNDIPPEDLIALARDSGTMDDDIDIEMNGHHPRINSSSLPYLLNTLSLPSRLASLANLTPLSFPPANNEPSIHPPTTAALSTVHLRALEALNNLLLTVAAFVADDPDAQSQVDGSVPLVALWEGMLGTASTLAQEPEVMKAKGQEMRIEVLEMAIGCAWGVAKVGVSHITITAPHLTLLLSLLPLVRNDDAKSRLIELLALIASRPAVSLEENQGISQALLQLLDSPESKGEVLIAVVNAIIDIYADETRAYDAVFTQGKYLDRLSGSVGRVRSLVKSIDKKKDRALRIRGEEAYENLASFVKYRRALHQ